MISNIELIRIAEKQIPLLREELRVLRKDALANDEIIDAQEQADIDRVEAKIDATQDLITDTRKSWEANRAAYDKRRSGLNAVLADVVSCDNDALHKDQKRVTDAAAKVDQASDAEDYATAMELCPKLEDLLARFQSLLEKLEETARLAEMTPEELADINLTEDDMDDVFSEEYMNELMDKEFAGEDDPDLKTLMAEIEKGVSGARRGEVMISLATIVGIPPSDAELDADYARFLVLLKQQDAIGDQNKSGEVPDLDTKKHPKFGASRGQLMFGQVLGDAFGIHSVFAALLSPTGGLVGPGNDLIPGVMDSPHLSPDNPVALHGTVHDAAGYLKSYHDAGPGYNYRDNPIESIATAAIELLPDDIEKVLLPLTGQLSGIAHWTWEAGDDFIEKRVDEAVVTLEKELTDARDAAAEDIDALFCIIDDAKEDMLDAAEELTHDAFNAAEEFGEDVADRLDEVAEAAEEFRDDVEDGIEDATVAIETFGGDVADAAEEFGDDVVDAAEDFRDDVEDGLDTAEEELRDLAQAAETEVLEAVDAFEDGVDRAANTAVEVYEEASAGAGAIGDAAMDKLDAVANFIWS